MKLVPIYWLFKIKYGNSLQLINLEQCRKDDPLAVNYVSRTERNNGVSAFVKMVDDIPLNPANTISVAVSGSVLSAFLQPESYYTGFHVFILSPIEEMSKVELLFYCECIRANKYKYNYGRQANRTFKDILVPQSLPAEFRRIDVDNIKRPDPKPIVKAIELDESDWYGFEIGELFDIRKGKRLTKEDMDKGDTPFVAAIDSNNGYREFISHTPIHDGNTITVNYNGSVAEAFYQPVPFWASDDVNVLYPKFEMNIYNALFIATVIEREKYRFNFGRKWHVDRMEKSVINLPAKNGEPDYDFMERYIKSLPYSASIMVEAKEVKPIHKPEKRAKVGLSDEELIKKYESGKVDMKETANKMLKKSPTSVKTNKEKVKR